LLPFGRILLIRCCQVKPLVDAGGSAGAAGRITQAVQIFLQLPADGLHGPDAGGRCRQQAGGQHQRKALALQEFSDLFHRLLLPSMFVYGLFWW